MNLNFNAVATSIIQKSIKSSIYIDDLLAEPFSEVSVEDKYYQISKGINKSFKDSKKPIDFYKYSVNGNWIDDSEYLFKCRDLLILDWQLIPTDGLAQLETLKILREAVNTGNLHFISIYTDRHEFSIIFYFIKGFFNPHYDENLVKNFSEFKNSINEDGIHDYFNNNFVGSIKGIFIELALAEESSKKPLMDKIKKEVQAHLDFEQDKARYGSFAKFLRTIHRDQELACEALGFIFNQALYSEKDDVFYDCKTPFHNEDFILVNHTIIQISKKGDPKPEELFETFTKALVKVCGNFLTMMSLEIRNLVRESSGFIGKDVDTINEAAFFYHREQNKHEFYNFLIEIWKSQSISFIYESYSKLQTLKPELWDNYKTDSQIDNKIEELVQDKGNFHESLHQLNYYYNVLNVKREVSDSIKFGDVFISSDAMGNSTGDFYLCITAHCDCLQPANIYNNFYFIRGNKHPSLEQALIEGDEGFNSFIKDAEHKSIVIKWNPKPIILNLPDVCIIGKTFDVQLGDKNLKFNYLSTLKENYGQRMANNAFSHAMRVGILFADAKV
jgi:hypothetical protein